MTSPNEFPKTEAERALGRLFNHNTDPDKARAHADRLLVLEALPRAERTALEVDTLHDIIDNWLGTHGEDCRSHEQDAMNDRLDCDCGLDATRRALAWLAEIAGGGPDGGPARSGVAVPARAEAGECVWTIDEFGDPAFYETSCGQAFTFNDGTASDNDVIFCHHCGKPMREVKMNTDEDDDDALPSPQEPT